MAPKNVTGGSETTVSPAPRRSERLIEKARKSSQNGVANGNVTSKKTRSSTAAASVAAKPTAATSTSAMLSTSQTGLLSLPAELTDTVSKYVSKADILNMRFACRDLLYKTAFNFCQRYFDDEITIKGTIQGFEDFKAVIQSPNLPAAQGMARRVIIESVKIRETDRKRFHNLPLPHRLPSPEHVMQLLTTIPNVDKVRIRENAPKWARLHVAPVILKGVAGMSPQLRQVSLFHANVNGELVAEVLKTHKHTLEKVQLFHIHLTSGSDWREIVKIMTSMELNQVWLGALHDDRVDDEEGPYAVRKDTFPQSIWTRWEESEGNVSISRFEAHLYGPPVKQSLEQIYVAWEDLRIAELA